MSKLSACLLLLFLATCLAQSSRNQNNRWTGLICANKKDTMKCPGTQSISVKYANYGRTVFIHPMCGIGFNTNCISKNSFKIVSDLCNGKNSCDLHASNDVFDNQCPWTKKYLALAWECN